MKVLKVLVALVGVQLVLFGAYQLVLAWRVVPATFQVEPLDEPAPALHVRRDGDELGAPNGTYLVHFWATWCAPCLVELPGLIEESADHHVQLVAVTDEPWPVVDRFFEHEVPPAIVRDPSGQAQAAWRVSGLPDTFVVRDGRVVGRVGGPRDWRTAEAGRFLGDLGR